MELQREAIKSKAMHQHQIMAQQQHQQQRLRQQQQLQQQVMAAARNQQPSSASVSDEDDDIVVLDGSPQFEVVYLYITKMTRTLQVLLMWDQNLFVFVCRFYDDVWSQL